MVKNSDWTRYQSALLLEFGITLIRSEEDPSEAWFMYEPDQQTTHSVCVQLKREDTNLTVRVERENVSKDPEIYYSNLLESLQKASGITEFTVEMSFFHWTFIFSN